MNTRQLRQRILDLAIHGKLMKHEEMDKEETEQLLIDTGMELLRHQWEALCGLGREDAGDMLGRMCPVWEDEPVREVCTMFHRREQSQGEEVQEYSPKDDRPMFCVASDEGDGYFESLARKRTAEEEERERLKDEFCRVVWRLQELGVSNVDILDMIQGHGQLSRLEVTADFRLLLTDYDKEILLPALPKALYLFYLRHPEGIAFKVLNDYRGELRMYYSLCSNRGPENIDQAIDSLCDQTSNRINEICSQIRKAVLAVLPDDNVARHYYISGRRGEYRCINLAKELLEWKVEK